MRNLEQAMALDSLRFGAKPEPETESRTAKEVTDAFYQEMRFRGTPMGVPPTEWRKTWLASDKFVLMHVPIGCVALPIFPRNTNHAIQRVHARNEKPIVVDTQQAGSRQA